MGNRIGRWQQTRIYVGKCWRLFINERQWKNLVSTLIITVLISFVTSEKTFEDFVQTKNSCFAIICACIWVGIFNSIQSICRERGIIKREHRTGLHISSYIGAHVIFEALLCAVEALIVLAVVLIKNSEHLPESGLVFPLAVDMYITLYLTIFASDMLAILVSCVVRDSTSAMTVMPFVLIVQLVFANFVIPLDSVGQTLSNGTITKWGIQAICTVSNYNSQESSVLLTALNTMNNDDPNSLVSRVQRVLSIEEVSHEVGSLTASQLQNSEYAFTAENVLKNWGILIAFTLLYVLIGFLFSLEIFEGD